MSKNETSMTRWYWKQLGGTLVEEFIVVHGSVDRGKRVPDGIILPSGEFRIAQQDEVSIEGKDVVVVQTKAGRLALPAADAQIVSLHNARHKRREKMFKAFNSKQLTNNKHIILGSWKKQHLLFSLVHLLLCSTKN